MAMTKLKPTAKKEFIKEIARQIKEGAEMAGATANDVFEVDGVKYSIKKVEQEPTK